MAVQIARQQIQDNAIDNNKLDLSANYTFTGTLAAGTPSADSDVAIKSYVDGLVAGLHWKKAVAAATTANITLSGTQTVDGVSLSAGARILVKDQTDATENGIYVVDSGAWSRADDMDVASEFPAAAVFVTAGTVNDNLGFVCTNDSDPTLGTTDIEFTQFNGAANITAGDGLTKTGNTLDVNVGSGLEISGDAVQIAASSVTDAMLAGSISNAKLATSTISGVSLGSNLNSLSASASGAITLTSYNGSAAVSDLAINVDGTTIGIASNSLELKNNAVDANKLASNAVVSTKISDGAVTSDKIQDGAVTASKIGDGTLGAAKLNFVASYETLSAGDGSTTTFDASAAGDSTMLGGTIVYRNGLAMGLVQSSPSGQDQYTVSADGGAGSTLSITFGAAPNSGDQITVFYMSL